MDRKEKRILIVAGEASADRYGARLVRRLSSRQDGFRLRFYGTGGDEMKAEGVELLAHARDLAQIGPHEAMTHFLNYLTAMRRLIRSSQAHPPELAILLDFPDFNLRLAKKMKRAGVKVIYYISPQLWAWRRGRVRTVKKYVDKMLVILPFEEEFYREHGIRVEFVGHPLLEDFAPRFDREVFHRELGLDPGRTTVAILPGSRRKEVEYILPTLLKAAQLILKRREAQFLISAAPTVDLHLFENIASSAVQGEADAGHFRIVTAESRDILANSDFAFVKCGTSTLEAALVGTPFVITYKISSASWRLGNILVHSTLKGLVNLIAKEEIVPEFLQEHANPEVLARAALEYLEKPEQAAQMKARLAAVRAMLSVRCATESVAAAVEAYL